MKKINILFIILLVVLLASCGETSLSFKVSYKEEIEIGEQTTLVIKDENDNSFTNPTIEVTVTEGLDVVSVDNLVVTGLKAGTAKLNVKVTANSVSGLKSINIKVLEDSDGEDLVVGLPTPELGFYMRDADIINDGDSRYLLYLTNDQSGEEDNVLAIRKAELTDDGYAYHEEHKIISPSNDGWDKYLGSASIVKGDFKYNNTDYNYLIAYQATTKTNDTSFSIGFAVATDPLSDWVKVGNKPVIKYDSDVYGEAYAGFYAPSLINLDKESTIRLFYTWADAYGHFTYFVDFVGNNLDEINLSGYAMLPNNGNLASGDDVKMIPNASFAYDSNNHKFYMVKDYSPTPTNNPRFADKIELAKINEEELYTALELNGWESLNVYDVFDTPESAYERLYSATIITDAYGHIISVDKIEIVYNVSNVEADNPDYIYSQKLMTFIYE